MISGHLDETVPYPEIKVYIYILEDITGYAMNDSRENVTILRSDAIYSNYEGTLSRT